MSILLTAILRAKPGKSAALKELLLQLVKGSQAEAACRQYDLHQSKDEPNLFIFHEEWADQEGFELHQRSEHHQKFAEEAAEHLDGKVAIHHTEKIG